MPAAVSWILVSFFSLTTLAAARVRIGSVPVSPVDVVVIWLGIATLVHFRAVRFRPTGSPILWSLVALIAYSVIPAAVGLRRHYGLYSVAIDVRTLVYLAIGYYSGRVLIDAYTRADLIWKLLLATAAGFVVAESVALGIALAGVARHAGRLIDLRDVGVPTFTGKYGIALSASTCGLGRLRRVAWAAILFVVAVDATVVTFIRTAWLAAAISILVVIAFLGTRAALKVTGLTLAAIFVLGLAATAVPSGRVLLEAAINRHVTSLNLAPSPSATARPSPPSTTEVSPSAGPLQRPLSPAPSTAASPPTTDTITVRLTESELALAHLKTPLDWIIGAGLGLSIDDAIHPYQHNSFVWLLSKSGLIGLMLFAFFVGMPVVAGLRSLLLGKSPRWHLLLVLLAAQVANLFSGFASGHLTYWALCPLLGMTIAWVEQLSGPESMVTEPATAA